MRNYVKYLIVITFLLFTGAVFAGKKTAAEQVYDTVGNAIFTIFDVKSYDHKNAIDYGSGVAVTKNVVATNCHVALKGDERLVKINHTFTPAKTIYVNHDDDLCLLQIADNTLKPVKIRNAKSVHVGEEVYTLGSPKGLEKSISRGIISNKIHYKDSYLLQTDAAISPGSSGGGLFDSESNLIGLTFSKDEGTGTEGIGFAIPADLLSAVLKQEHLT